MEANLPETRREGGCGFVCESSGLMGPGTQRVAEECERQVTQSPRALSWLPSLCAFFRRAAMAGGAQ